MLEKSIIQFIKRMFKTSKAKKYMDSNIVDKEHGVSHRVSPALGKNIEIIKSYLSKSDDLVFKNFKINTIPPLKATVVYLESMIDNKLLESSTIEPLTKRLSDQDDEKRKALGSSIQNLLEENLVNSNIKMYKDYESIIKDVLNGKGILFIDGFIEVVSVDVTKETQKTFSEPKTEKVIKGPQEGFVEDINTNTWLIRRKVKSPHLVMKSLQIGTETDTEIRVMYLENIADLTIVEELFLRLDAIDVDGIRGSGSIEEFINDSPRNVFNTTFSTERPDRVSSMILEGRIAILVDGTPFSIVIPAIIADFFTTTEDYDQNYYSGTFNRLLGYFGALVVLFLPSIYIAISSYHQEMIPTRLALTIAGTRAGVPYPAFMEAFMMEIAFEGLRQAGVRLPTHVGQAVSIVGALIIGQAAVDTGLVSPAVVIIVATTAIFSFTLPYNNFSLSIRLLRFFNMALATVLGIFGVMTGFLLIFLNLVSLRSFGVNFMVPFAPLSIKDFKDWLVRFPSWANTSRSNHIVRENLTRAGESLRPQPSDKRKGK